MSPPVLVITGTGAVLHLSEGGADGAAMTLSVSDATKRQCLSLSLTEADVGTISAAMAAKRASQLEVASW